MSKKQYRINVQNNLVEDGKPYHLPSLSFNFTYLTKMKKFSLEYLDKKYQHQVFNKLEYLSAITLADLKVLGRKSGIETIPNLLKEVTPVAFKTSRQFNDCKDGYSVFRAGGAVRVIGKMNQNIFYVIAIDTKFELYKH